VCWTSISVQPYYAFHETALVGGIADRRGIAVVFVPAVLYWHFQRPWQHVVNLEDFYQTKIASASPHDRNPRNNLAGLPAGHRTFDGVRFNVVGIIQLADGNDVTQTNNLYPESIEDISVNRTCRQLHLLHGTVQGLGDQLVVASLLLHYADGTTGKLDIVYGQHVYDWWFKESSDLPLASGTKVAWVGQNRRRRGVDTASGSSRAPLTTLNLT